jgi:hypothetical protein
VRRPVLIGIHGLGNKPGHQLLSRWWKTAIIEGLLEGPGVAPLFRFVLAYWADCFYAKPLDPQRSNPHDPLFLEEPYLPGDRDLQKTKGRFGSEMVDFLRSTVDRLVLSDYFRRAAPSFTERMVHEHFVEVEAYFSSQPASSTAPAPKELVRQRLVALLAKHRKHDITLLAHSMGSVIAFDVLSLHQDLAVDTFVTIGSPLGIPYLIHKMNEERARLQVGDLPMRVPATIKRAWYNFADSDDRVGTHFTLGERFLPSDDGIRPDDRIVVNDYCSVGVRNPHKSYGYLRCQELSAIIRDRTSAGRSRVRLWIETRMSRLLLDWACRRLPEQGTCGSTARAGR